MTVATYDPKNIIVILGSHIVSGYADGSFVTAERNNDTWTTMAGASGEAARAKSNDRTGKVTLTLMQTSLSNDVLSGFAVADELSNSGKFPVVIKEVGGATLVEATEGWVVRPAKVEFGKELNSREWVVEAGELFIAVGGQPN